MAKVYLETEDGQKMTLSFDCADISMDFPETNTRTIDISDDKLVIKKIESGNDEVKIPA